MYTETISYDSSKRDSAQVYSFALFIQVKQSPQVDPEPCIFRCLLYYISLYSLFIQSRVERKNVMQLAVISALVLPRDHEGRHGHSSRIKALVVSSSCCFIFFPSLLFFSFVSFNHPRKVRLTTCDKVPNVHYQKIPSIHPSYLKEPMERCNNLGR